MEKKIAFCVTKMINVLTLMLSKKKILNETKNHNPPQQVKWLIPYITFVKTKLVKRGFYVY